MYPPSSEPQPPPTFQPGSAAPPYVQSQPGYPPTSAFPSYPPTSAPPGYPPTSAPPGYPPVRPAGPGGGGSNTLLWVLIAVFTVLLCVGAGVAGTIAYRNGQSTRSAGPTPAPTGVAPERSIEPSSAGTTLLVFEVTGSGRAIVSYLVHNTAGPKLIGSVTLPWRVEVVAPEEAGLVNVLATRTSSGDESITCRILANGQELASHSDQGAVATVACIGVTPG